MKYKYCHDKKRQFISIIVAMLYWYSSSIFTKTTKTFLKIPVFITNISSESFIHDIDENGKMLQYVTLVLKGNKEKLKRVEQEKLKVVLNLKDQKRSFLSIRVQAENIYYDNQKISNIKDIENIFSPEVTIKIEQKIRKEIPVMVKIPNILKDDILGVLPNKFNQVIDGTKAQVENQESSGLVWEVPEKLIQVIKTQNINNPCFEKGYNLYIPKPQRTIKTPAIRQEPIQISDPHIDNMKIFMMPQKHSVIKIKTEILVDPRISHLFKIIYSNSPEISICLENVSHIFVESAKGHVHVQLCIKNNKAELELGIINVTKWKKTFTELFLKNNSDLVCKDIKKIAEKYFYHYINSMKIPFEDQQCLLSKINIYKKTIHINT